MDKSRIHLLAIPIIVGVALVRLAGGAGGEPKTDGGDGEQTAETVVFDLHYRALTGQDDPLSYRSFWGFGASPPENVPFVEAVKKQVKEFDLVHNRSLPSRQWSVVELQDKKPVALYFDLNADGQLSGGERIEPASSQSPQSGGYAFSFVTPDFMLRREDGREISFRIMLVADSYGGDRMNYMWSPCCLLEGQAVFAGAATRLFLYGNGFTGSFDTFGVCSFTIVPVQQKLEGYLPRATLSSLICHEGTFYRLSLEGSPEKDKMLRIKIRKDTSPTGRVAVNLKGKEALKARLTRATITGDKDDTIRFSMGDARSTIPIGRYRLDSGYVCYGTESDDEWQVNFSEGPAFAIGESQTTGVDLGDLSLTITAVNERERYQSDVKPRSTFAKGASIYLAPQIKGKAGEAYMRFSRKGAEKNQWNDVKPHVAILNAAGKEVAAADMEYG